MFGFNLFYTHGAKGSSPLSPITFLGSKQPFLMITPNIKKPIKINLRAFYLCFLAQVLHIT